MADSGEAAGGERPMRRSRMLSDDARLALQLQDEELKAARGMKRVKAPSAPAAKDAGAPAPAVKKPKTEPKKPPLSAPAKSAAPAKIGKQPANSGGAGGKGKTSAGQASSSRAAPAPKTERGAGAAKSAAKEAPASAKASSSSQKVPSDSVYFTLEPWPSAQEEVPTLRRSSMTLHEDQTVLSIKRRVVEEAYPGTDVSRVEIRTPTGIKCGQDHSLKYVRTFLWPVSKGDLVMYYCQAPDSFL